MALRAIAEQYTFHFSVKLFELVSTTAAVALADDFTKGQLLVLQYITTEIKMP